MCKGNYVQYVRINICIGNRQAEDVIILIILLYIHIDISLDSHGYRYIIILTHNLTLGDRGGCCSGSQYQKRGSPKAGGIESQTGTGCRLAFSAGSLFRSQRSGAGQVRNAAAGATGWSYGQPGLFGFWFVTSIVLPGPRGVPTRWTSGFGQEKARASRPTQADAGSAGICPPAAPTGSKPELACVKPEDNGTIRYRGSSPHDRTGRWRIEKKTSGREVKIKLGQALTERYEALRNGACGYGRALLMAQGITTWMQVWSQSAPLGERCARLSSDTGPKYIERRISERVVPESAQSELVRVMAAMAWAVARGVML